MRERWLAGSKAVEHHLNAQVNDRQVDHLRIGYVEVRLDEGAHRHQCGRNRLLPRPVVSIHALQLGLELVAEQFSTVKPQKPEQLSHPIESLDQHLLSTRQLYRRRPALDRHRVLHAGKCARTAELITSLDRSRSPTAIPRNFSRKKPIGVLGGRTSSGLLRSLCSAVASLAGSEPRSSCPLAREARPSRFH